MKLLKPEGLRQEASYLRLCCFGEPGTGKSWFGASAALDDLTAPCMYLEYRAQIASLRSNEEYLTAMEDGRLVILTLDEYADLNHVYSWLYQGPGSNEAFDGIFPVFPKTLVIDSTTELQRAEVMRIAGNTPGKFTRDVERPLIQHWGNLLNQFTLLAHLFYQLPMNVVFLGLEAVDYAAAAVGQPDRPIGFRLALQGQAQRQFPAYALTVMRLTRAARNADHYANGTTQSVKAKTKEQTGAFPAVIPNPSIPGMVKLLYKFS